MAAPAYSSRPLVIIGILLVSAIAGSGAVLIQALRGAVQTEHRRSVTNLAQLLAEQTSRSMVAIDLTMRGIGLRLESIAATSPAPMAAILDSASTFDMLVDGLKALPQISRLQIVDAAGRLANVTTGFPAPELDVSDRDYLRHFRARDDPAVFVSQPARSRQSPEWVVFLAHRINAPGGRFAGVLVATVSLSKLEEFFATALPADTAATLLRLDGTILAHSPHGQNAAGGKMPAGSDWYRMVAQGGGSYRSPGFLDGIPYLIAVRPLRDFPMVIDAGTPEAAVRAVWQRETLWVLVGGVLASGCVILLLLVFDRQLRMLSRQNRLLEDSRIRFNAALDHMSQGLTFFGEDQTLIVANRRYREMHRLTPDQVRPGLDITDLLRHRSAQDSFPDMTIAAYLAQREALAQYGQSFEMTEELRDGRSIVMRCHKLPNGGWITTHEDVTARRGAEARLAFMAHHDALTHLPNRVLFQERLTQALAMSGRGSGCALLCLDLDGFKAVNDSFGHPVGDQLLRGVAERLAGVVREVDTVARLGGDEFAIVQLGLDSPAGAALLAERIVKVISMPFELDSVTAKVGVSIGISMAPDDTNAAATLMRNADSALYLAKQQGRGGYRFFSMALAARSSAGI